jgi:hypothetical protein
VANWKANRDRRCCCIMFRTCCPNVFF